MLLDELKAHAENLEQKDMNAEQLKNEEIELEKSLENMLNMNYNKQENQNLFQDVPKTKKNDITSFTSTTDEMLSAQLAQMVSCTLNVYSVSFSDTHTHTHSLSFVITSIKLILYNLQNFYFLNSFSKLQDELEKKKSESQPRPQEDFSHLVDPSAPGVLLSSATKPKKKRGPRTKITLVSDQNPLCFVYTSLPFEGSKFNAPFRCRYVRLLVIHPYQHTLITFCDGPFRLVCSRYDKFSTNSCILFF
jgi:hypothetical protein